MSLKVTSFAALLATLISTPSFALVRLLDSCQTSNAQYKISILDNQGTGRVRTSNFGATITDSQGNVVGSYALKGERGMSISFGRFQYLDSASNGASFRLAYPSTNFRFTTFKAVLSNGTTVSDDNLRCNSNR